MVLFPGCCGCGDGGGGGPDPGNEWACFECTACLVVAFETAGTDDPDNNTFELGPHLTGHTAHAGRPYRFVEVGANCDGVDPDDPNGNYTYIGAGYITDDGVIGDPWIDYDPATGIYTSSYPYRGYLRLQIGCESPGGGDEYTAIYSDDCTDAQCVNGWACFECTPCLVVEFETAGTGDPDNNTFELGPYLTGHTAHAGRPYRFVEVGANCDGIDPDDPNGVYTWHGAGYITKDGVIGDPWIDYNPATGIYSSSYPYRGYLRLQIGCESPEGGDEYTAIYSDDCTDAQC